MLKDIVAAKALNGYCLYLRFEDGVEGVVDLAPLLNFQGVFEPLRDQPISRRSASIRRWAP